MRFQEALVASGLPRLEAMALIQAASGRSREWLVAHELDAIDLAAHTLFKRLTDARHAGKPIAYLVGWREFYGRAFWVNHHTLIPRMDTELLVDTALSLLREMHATGSEPPRICDLGTGSGCIAITIALELGARVHVTATDQSAGALQMARNNAAWLGASAGMGFLAGSWWDAFAEDANRHGLSAQRFHGIVSNPPYVREGDLHLSQGDLRFEPADALRSGESGLADIKAIAMGASERLEPKGFLLIEHGFDQQDDVQGIFAAAGLGSIRGLRDLAGQPRAVLGFKD